VIKVQPAPPVSPNKRKILLKTLEQLHIDNLALMSSCIEFAPKSFKALVRICNSHLLTKDLQSFFKLSILSFLKKSSIPLQYYIKFYKFK